VYSKNRERLLKEEIAESFFQRVLERARPFMSDEHFTVDGTLIEAWASHKSFRPKDGTGQPPTISLVRQPWWSQWVDATLSWSLLAGV
jgi:hypothetical protein